MPPSGRALARTSPPVSVWPSAGARTTASVPAADRSLLVANLDGTLVAYLDRCPDCGAGLGDAPLVHEELTCAECGNAFDLRHAGRGQGQRLTPVPLLPDHGAWKVSLPQQESA